MKYRPSEIAFSPSAIGGGAWVNQNGDGRGERIIGKVLSDALKIKLSPPARQRGIWYGGKD